VAEPAARDTTVRLVTDGPDQTRALGERVGAALRAGDLLLLEGQFGTGKTTFVQGLARGLGVESSVTSPSFVIVHQHAGRLPLAHVDLYRLDRLDDDLLETIAELLDAGGVCAIEWPEHVPVDLRAGATELRFSRLDDERRAIELRSPERRLREAAERHAAGA
jgi:tRNA threonylcarbamoyladenosine biosynthesis protein TsaE